MTAPSNECIPRFEPGGRVTIKATANIVGKTFVGVAATLDSTEDYLIKGVTATADGPYIGVASHDIASGEKGTVLAGPGYILPVTNNGGVTAGQELELDTLGKVKTYADGVKVGLCLQTAADEADTLIKLY